MNQPSSSTSSSELPLRAQLRDLALVALWSVASLLAIDVGLGLALGDPPRGPEQSRSQLHRYFEYGRSVEGKIRLMVGPSDELTHPMALTGWLEPPADQPRTVPDGSDLLVAVYGMSFSAHASLAMHEQDPGIAVRNAGGPGATLSHSYAMYQRDRGEHEASVIVLGLLASSFPSLSTVTHATWNFESPSPHFYPRYAIEGGLLSASPPLVASLDELRSALADEARFDQVVAGIAENDVFYDRFVFRESFLDRSVIARTVRRAWGQRAKRAAIGRFHTPRGFTNELNAVDIARGIVRSFVGQVRADGKLPVLLLINDQGYSDHLYRTLLPVIEEIGVDCVSTHEIAPATDLSNFVRDGHFTPENDSRIGKALGEVINRALNRRPR